MTPIEILQQEHAIYKDFYESFINRPMNMPGQEVVHPMQRMRIAGSVLIERLDKLRKGQMYCDPTWANADKILFPIQSSSGENNS